MIANWRQTRGRRIGVAVSANKTLKSLHATLQSRLPNQVVQMYTYDQRNEHELDLLNPSITILNTRSIKGQEFDTVFVLELAVLLLSQSEEDHRALYMLCSRARDYLFLVNQGSSLPTNIIDRCPSKDLLIQS